MPTSLRTCKHRISSAAFRLPQLVVCFKFLIEFIQLVLFTLSGNNVGMVSKHAVVSHQSLCAGARG